MLNQIESENYFTCNKVQFFLLCFISVILLYSYNVDTDLKRQGSKVSQDNNIFLKNQNIIFFEVSQLCIYVFTFSQ